MSWISDLVRQILGMPKSKNIMAPHVICNRLTVVGPKCYVDIYSNKDGARIVLLPQIGEYAENHVGFTIKDGGNCSIDLIGKGGIPLAGIDMFHDGRIVNRFPAPTLLEPLIPEPGP